jgi:hypothetical protein
MASMYGMYGLRRTVKSKPLPKALNKLLARAK